MMTQCLIWAKNLLAARNRSLHTIQITLHNRLVELRYKAAKVVDLSIEKSPPQN